MYLSGLIKLWVVLSIPIMELCFYGHLYMTLTLIFVRILDGVHRYLHRKDYMDEMVELAEDTHRIIIEDSE